MERTDGGSLWYGGRVLSGGILQLTCSISSHFHWYRTGVEDGFPCQLGAGTTATWQDLLWMVAYLQSEVSSHRPLTAGVTCRAAHGCDEQCLAKQWETKSLKYEASKEMEVGIAKKKKWKIMLKGGWVMKVHSITRVEENEPLKKKILSNSTWILYWRTWCTATEQFAMVIMWSWYKFIAWLNTFLHQAIHTAGSYHCREPTFEKESTFSHECYDSSFCDGVCDAQLH